MCCIGIAMVMQQAKIARLNRPRATLGRSPATRPPRGGSAWKAPEAGVSGGGRKNSSASGITRQGTMAAYSSIALRQPNASTVYWNVSGQTTPATYWPEEISAMAAPRRRSNQRDT